MRRADRCAVVLACVLAALPAACVTTRNVPPFQSAADLGMLEEEERRVWHGAEQFAASIERSGALHDDAEVEAWLQSIMDRLFPEFEGALRVHVVTSPVLNAFCLANGDVYVHSAIVAAARNEAQIATVLAHEGAHFTYRHGYRRTTTAKRLSSVSTALGMAGLPLAGLAAAGPMFGFSRDNERQADQEGFRRLVAAGYDAAQARVPFERMAEWVAALDADMPPYFFSSHPRLAERVEEFDRLTAEHIGRAGPDGVTGEEVFVARSRGLAVLAIEELLARSRPEGVILLLEDPAARARLAPHASYWLGEAYRLRGHDGDEQRSLDAWEQARDAASSWAPTYRALGRHHLRHGDQARAASLLRRYLELAPGAADRSFVEGTLVGLEGP